MVTCLLAGIGLLSWPPSIGAPGKSVGGTARRKIWISESTRARPTIVLAQSAVALIVLVVLLISVLSGWMIGLSASLLLVTLALLARSEARRRREQIDLGEFLAATRTLCREVRAGAGPGMAILATAEAHGGRSGRMLRALATRVAIEQGVSSGIHDDRADAGLAAEITDRLARGWSLSARYGVPWAALIETVSVDLADRLHAKSQRSAQVSGPRVSGYVLAVMPGLGVLLGVGMGANPLHVLFGTGPGHLMLLIGTALTCAGLAWTARIVKA